MWLTGSSLWHVDFSVAVSGIYFSSQRLNLGFLHCKCSDRRRGGTDMWGRRPSGTGTLPRVPQLRPPCPARQPVDPALGGVRPRCALGAPSCQLSCSRVPLQPASLWLSTPCSRISAEAPWRGPSC